MAKKSNDGGGLILLILAFFGLLLSLFKYPIPTLIGINILTLIFYPDYFWTVFMISVLIGLIYYATKKSASPKKSNGVQPDDKKKNRQDIINEYLTKLYRDSFPYYAENKTRDCIREIMTVEGASSKAPKFNEYLSSWLTRNDVPQAYKDLARAIQNQFKERLNKLKAEEADRQKVRNQIAQKELDVEVQDLWRQNTDLIEKFFEIAERKISILDDYGDEHWDALPIEINSVIKKIAQKEGIAESSINEYFKKGHAWTIGSKYPALKKRLDEEFRIRHSKPRQARSDYNSLSGVEFETHVAHLLQQKSYAVSGTPTTGDQGADLIAKKDGKTIIIQAKRYIGSVGNKAVQEVIGAVQFYSGDEGWVITNSTFTPSAKALAQKSGVKLIDGSSLGNLE